MSNPSQGRKNLEYVDPARFTPHFAWKARGEAKEVYCEGVALTEIAKRFGTPTYVYSRRPSKTRLTSWIAGWDVYRTCCALQ